jgi:hypothetical protein
MRVACPFVLSALLLFSNALQSASHDAHAPLGPILRNCPTCLNSKTGRATYLPGETRISLFLVRLWQSGICDQLEDHAGFPGRRNDKIRP